MTKVWHHLFKHLAPIDEFELEKVYFRKWDHLPENTTNHARIANCEINCTINNIGIPLTFKSEFFCFSKNRTSIF